MDYRDTDRSAGMPDTIPDGSGRNSREHGNGVSNTTADWEHSRSETQQLMDAVVERENMAAAMRRVKRNKGAPGIDGMTVEELLPFLREHWPRIKEELLSGTYRPEAVREVMILKRGGKGMRKLGIPTVVDRLIQQALHQVLVPVFDPARHKAAPFLRCYRTSCWTIWTRNWKDGVTRFAVTLMTATSMCGHGVRENGCCLPLLAT